MFRVAARAMQGTVARLLPTTMRPSTTQARVWALDVQQTVLYLLPDAPVTTVTMGLFFPN